MEIVDRIFGGSKRKQEKLLEGIKIEGQPQKELVGLDRKEELVANIPNEEFLRLIKERQINQYESYSRPMSDTHDSVELLLEIGEGLKLRTKAAKNLYNKERTILNDLWDMNFRSYEKEDKSGPYIGLWEIYRREK